MPEAFGESEEFLAEVRRLRPAWIRLDREKEAWRKRNLVDWRPGRGSFWDRVRESPSQVAHHMKTLEGGMIDIARAEAQERRDAARSAGWRFETTRLGTMMARPDRPMPGWSGAPLEPWRASAFEWATTALTAGPYADWVDPYLNVADHIGSAAWASFWLHEVDATALSRWWIRDACEFLMSMRKVTPGTPCDVQLATHLFDCDAFVTTDKNFHEVLTACMVTAPREMGKSVLVRVHPDGFSGILQTLDVLRRTLAREIGP